jgi:RNA polymerase sigma-70 factor (ECF subfamily)
MSSRNWLEKRSIKKLVLILMMPWIGGWGGAGRNVVTIKFFWNFRPLARQYGTDAQLHRPGGPPMNSQNLPDEGLLAGARNGCRESFAVLYQRHQGRVYRFALTMTGSEALAEEVTQEVFLTLLGELDGYDSRRGSLPGYLLGVARNHTYRIMRRERSFVAIDTNEGGEGMSPWAATPNLADELASDQARRQLHAAIGALPPAYREVILLCEIEGLDYAQAAQALGCPIGTVRSRLHRARALLVEKWIAGRKYASSARCSL